MNRKKINKKTVDLNNIIKQLDLADISRILQSTTKDILLKCTWNTPQNKPYSSS